MSDTGFDAVARAFESSQLYGAWRSLTDGFAVASREAALLRPVRAFVSAFEQSPAGRKLAFCATLIGIAALAHLAIRTTLPPYTISGLPWWWNLTEALFAFGVAIESDAIAKAWKDSTPARIWRLLAR
jgi:hypothetical protein